MANNKFDLQAFFNNIEGKTWSLGSAFKRADALPLDLYSVWETKEEAETYAAEHPTAYPGQTLIVVEKEGEGEAAVDKIKLYYIDENRELQEVGSATLGDDETIVLDPETKKLSIKGFADAQPETRLIKNKNGQLEWTADSQSAITGDISDLKSGLEDVEGRVDVVEEAIAGLGDIVNFAGVVADIANVKADDYEPGDILIEKKTTGEGENIKTVITEYICSKKSETENEWVSLGDPEGVTALQARMNTAEGKITDLESDLSDLTDYVGTIPTDEGIESTNIVDYAEEVAADALDAAKTYADGKVQALAEGAVDTNTKAIAKNAEDIVKANSDISNLNTNKLEKSEFDKFKTDNTKAIADAVSGIGINEYLKKEEAATTYYTQVSATKLQSDVDILTGVVINGDNGNAKLREAINGVKATADQNKLDIAENVKDIAANGSAITVLQGRATNLEAKDTEHSSAIEAANSNIAANKTAIEVIYKAGVEGSEATGVLAQEIKDARAAEAKITEDLGKETKRATEAEAALAEQIEGLESADGAQDDLIAKLREDVDGINETTIPTLETKSDAEAKLKAAKDYTDEKITEVNSEIDDIQKEIGSLANVMHFAGALTVGEIIDDKLVGGGDYEITSIVVNDATESADETLTVVSNKSFDKGDVGIYEQKEYVCIAIDDATEDSVFTSTWTAIGDVGATSALIEGLEKSKLDKTEFEDYKTETLTPKFNAIDKAITDANSAIAGEKERAEGVEKGLADRLTAVEGKASTNEANIATNVTNIAANAKAIEDLDTELSSRIENLLEWGSF